MRYWMIVQLLKIVAWLASGNAGLALDAEGDSGYWKTRKGIMELDSELNPKWSPITIEQFDEPMPVFDEPMKQDEHEYW